MPFHLEPVSSDSDFDVIIPALWNAFHNPFQSFFPLFCPLLGSGPDAYANSVQSSTDLYRGWHNSDPTSNWLKVLDSKTGNLAAAAQWKVCEKDPFAEENQNGGNEEEQGAFWQPTGTQREFVTQALGIFEQPRSKVMRKPHVCLSILFTSPEYRGKGAATLAMEWGIKRADEMGVEAWVDATASGRRLYEKYGFLVLAESDLAPQVESPSAEWKKLQEEFATAHVWHLWRPAGGQLRPGESPPRVEH